MSIMNNFLSTSESANVRLSTNFTLKEMTQSYTARVHKLNNTPNSAERKNLRRLCVNVLQPVRNHFGVPVIIRSAFRCPAVNTILKESPSSQHLHGEAADFRVKGIALREVAAWIAENLNYDILMLEYPGNNPNGNGWLHVSYREKDNRGFNLLSETDRKKYKFTAGFSLQELVDSATARSRNIFNVPDEAGIERLRQVCQHILQPVRDHFGKPVRVNSGFRSPALNNVIKGSSRTSQHMKCEAVDYEIAGLDNHDLANWVINNLEYDQVILEYHGDDSDDPNDGWVHTSYVAPPRKNRRQKLTIDKKGTRSGIAKS